MARPSLSQSQSQSELQLTSHDTKLLSPVPGAGAGLVPVVPQPQPQAQAPPRLLPALSGTVVVQPKNGFLSARPSYSVINKGYRMAAVIPFGSTGSAHATGELHDTAVSVSRPSGGVSGGAGTTVVTGFPERGAGGAAELPGISGGARITPLSSDDDLTRAMVAADDTADKQLSSGFMWPAPKWVDAFSGAELLVSLCAAVVLALVLALPAQSIPLASPLVGDGPPSYEDVNGLNVRYTARAFDASLEFDTSRAFGAAVRAHWVYVFVYSPLFSCLVMLNFLEPMLWRLARLSHLQPRFRLNNTCIRLWMYPFVAAVAVAVSVLAIGLGGGFFSLNGLVFASGAVVAGMLGNWLVFPADLLRSRYVRTVRRNFVLVCTWLPLLVLFLVTFRKSTAGRQAGLLVALNLGEFLYRWVVSAAHDLPVMLSAKLFVGPFFLLGLAELFGYIALCTAQSPATLVLSFFLQTSVCVVQPLVLTERVWRWKIAVERRVFGWTNSDSLSQHRTKYAGTLFFSLWSHAASAVIFIGLSTALRFGPNADWFMLSPALITDVAYTRALVFAGIQAVASFVELFVFRYVVQRVWERDLFRPAYYALRDIPRTVWIAHIHLALYVPWLLLTHHRLTGT